MKSNTRLLQTNSPTLMPATYLQEPTITQVLLSLTPTWSFSLQERCLVTGEFGYCTEFNTTSLEEIKPVWCSWDWSGILERHEEGYSTANFTLLQLLSFPNTTVCLTWALLMAKLSALKHLCKELWKQIHLSLLFFLYPFQRRANSHASISHEVFSQKVPLGNVFPVERDYSCNM